MKIWSVVASIVLHIAASSPLWISWWSKDYKKDLQDTMPCTVPLEVTAVTEESMAPISKPKGERDDPKSDAADTELPKPNIPEEKSESMANQEVPQEALEQNALPVEEEKRSPSELADELEKAQQEKAEQEKAEQEKAEQEKAEQEKAKLEAAKKEMEEAKKRELAKQEKEAKEREDKAKKAREVKAKKALAEKKKKEKAKKAQETKKNASRDNVEDLLDVFEKKEKSNKKTNRRVMQNVDRDLRDGGEAETPITDPNSSSEYGASKVGPAMSLSIMDRVKRALERVWRVPMKVQDGRPLVVVVTVYTNPDGTVNKAVILDREGTYDHPAYALACQSALRAIEVFKTRPLPFEPAPYEQWKVFTTRFGNT